MQRTTTQDHVNRVIDFIQNEIAEKHFLPGDRLPSERKLSEMLSVGRPHVRTALQRMETYGIVETHPQSGTIVTEFTKEQLGDLISETLKLEKYDLYSLVHVRVLLELEACRLAIQNCTTEDIDRTERALRELEECQDAEQRIEKDFNFHHELVLCSHNQVIADLFAIITPDIMRYYHKYRFCSVPERRVTTEHRNIISMLKERDTDGLREIALCHLSNQIEFAKNLKRQ